MNITYSGIETAIIWPRIVTQIIDGEENGVIWNTE